MSKLVLGYIIFVIVVHCIALSYIIPLAVHYPIKTLRIGVIYLLAVLLSGLSRLIFCIETVHTSHMLEQSVYTLTGLLDFVSLTVITVTLPRVIHGYFDIPFPRYLYSAFLIQPAIMLYSILGSRYAFFWKVLQGTVMVSIPFFVSHIYCMALLFGGFFRKKVYQRKFMIYGFILSVIYLVPGFVDCFWPLFDVIHFKKPAGFSFSLISILLSSVLVIRFAYPYLAGIGGCVQKKNRVSPQDLNFTAREQEVLDMIISGYTNDQIAANLQISSSTVKKHVYNMFQKTGSENRIDLINACGDF